MYGLLQEDIDIIIKSISSFREIDKAVLFGSRAIGNYKKGSDIDIAIFGINVTNDIIYRLNDILNEENYMPYFFDVVHFQTIKNENLKEHIINKGIDIYSV